MRIERLRRKCDTRFPLFLKANFYHDEEHVLNNISICTHVVLN